MDERDLSRWISGMPDAALSCVVPYIEDPRDCGAISLVCRRWYEVDAMCRKHITIAMCYSANPRSLSRRFPHLESLKLKGQPRASMFNLIPEDWGGYVTPWVQEIAKSLRCLRSLHFRRMIVNDSDLELVASARGGALHMLKLDKCSGFSTDGLLCITSSCRNLRTLFLEECKIEDRGGEWLHEIAVNNKVLQHLNFFSTDLVDIRNEDLELVARNCRSLVSMKIGDSEVGDLTGFFSAAVGLEEFGGGCYNKNDPETYADIKFPQKLWSLGLSYISEKEMYIVLPLASRLKKLDLLFAMLDTEDHCVIIERCSNLEVLEVRNVIGDKGLEILSQSCKKLRRLRIERGADDQEIGDVEGAVTQKGVSALAMGCRELEYLAVYVTDISNKALEDVGTYLKNLHDFRVVLLDVQDSICDLPLDNGVRVLLNGCEKLERFALYLRYGGLTDLGLKYIGQHSQNIRWMLLGPSGESDAGLAALADGCPNLQKLEIRGCLFSERALAQAAMRLRSLRYFWVQGFVPAPPFTHSISVLAREFWNIEMITPREIVVGFDGKEVVIEYPPHILAYRSLAGHRSDFPESVLPLGPDAPYRVGT